MSYKKIDLKWKTFDISVIYVQIPCLWKFLFVIYNEKSAGPIKLQDSLKNNILKVISVVFWFFVLR